MHNILLIVDVQHDFVAGALGSAKAEQVMQDIARYAKQKAKEGWHLVFTRDTHDDNYLDTREGKKLPVPHCIRRTPGHAICDAVRESVEFSKRMDIIDKSGFGYLQWADEQTDAGALCPDVDRLEVCGFCTDICVVSNVLDLRNRLDCEIDILENLCAGTTEEKHRAALAVMDSCQCNIKTAEIK